MKRISNHKFSVMPGEQVVIRVTPVALQLGFLLATLDGRPLTPSNGSRAAKYAFVVARPVGETHVCVFDAAFPAESPEQAAYKFSVMDSSGEAQENFSLLKREMLYEVQLWFHVNDDGVRELEGDPPIIVQHHPPEPWD